MAHKSKDETKSWLVRLRHGALAVGVCASLAVATIGAGSAEARVPSGADLNDPFTRDCKDYQNLYDAGYGRFVGTGGKDKDGKTLMEQAEDLWRITGCNTVFGSIAARALIYGQK